MNNAKDFEKKVKENRDTNNFSRNAYIYIGNYNNNSFTIDFTTKTEELTPEAKSIKLKTFTVTSTTLNLCSLEVLTAWCSLKGMYSK